MKIIAECKGCYWGHTTMRLVFTEKGRPLWVCEKCGFRNSEDRIQRLSDSCFLCNSDSCVDCGVAQARKGE